METAAASADPRRALQELADSSFQTRQASIMRNAMAIPGAVQTTPAAAEALLARQREREATAKQVEEAEAGRHAKVAAKRAEVTARDAAKSEPSTQESSKLGPSKYDQDKRAVSAAQAAEEAAELRERGNAAMGRGDLEIARSCYAAALALGEALPAQERAKCASRRSNSDPLLPRARAYKRALRPATSLLTPEFDPS